MPETSQRRIPAAPAAPIGLTALQRDTMLVIQELAALLGRPPMLREIAAELFEVANPGRVSKILRALKARGYLDWVPAARNSLVVRTAVPLPDALREVRPRLEILRLPEGASP